jgi:myo-inositol-1(or 4)-monophosphatase
MIKTHKEASQKEIYSAVNFVEQIMPTAGEIALRYFRQPLAIDNKQGLAGFDPVTCADRDVESFLRKELSQRFPEYGIVGEESGTTPGSSGFDWLIDPIDGTKAFISGFPTWGLLVGLKLDHRALAGIMYQPLTKELFSAAFGKATLTIGEHQYSLKTRPTERLEDAILYCTHESMFVDSSHLEAFRRISSKCLLQRFGGDCYSYCMLAHGQIDLVIEDTLKPYDILPLIPIVESAGGVITNEQGLTPIEGGFVIAAANRPLHEQAMSLL